MIYKKSVVLKSIKGGKQKAVVTLEYDSGEMLGNVRLYNFDKEPDGILSLGLLNNGEVIKAGLTKENNSFYTFKINGEKELSNFSCALVNFVKGEATPLLMGSSCGATENEQRLCNSLSVFDEKPQMDRVEEILDQNQVYLEDQEQIDDLIDEEIKSSQCDNRCSECKYRDAFFKLGDDLTPKKEEEETFLSGIKGQIDELFDKYPEEEILKQIIPDSKWVKIDYEEKGEYYVVGLLYENNQIKYVCYGVPSMYQDQPPKELNGFAQWLPIDTQKEYGFGYWITYQDAQTGENVVLDYQTV